MADQQRGGAAGGPIPGWALDLGALEREVAAALDSSPYASTAAQGGRGEPGAGGLAPSANGLMREVSAYLLRTGGKRLRPALVLLCAQAGPMGPAGAHAAMPLAVAAEILHTATLVHDDVVDQAALRRGQPTVAAQWGTRVAVLAGDYLFARALTLVALLGRPEISARLGEVVQGMCEAELEQVERAYDVTYTEAEYLDLVRRKSATLIAECCRSGADLAGASPATSAALHRFGESLGIAFQVADDILDVVAATEQVGKPTGRDIGLGLLTLPVIAAVRGDRQLAALLERRLERPDDRQRALELIRAGGAIGYAQQTAWLYVRRAVDQLTQLAPGEPRNSLAALAAFAIQRSH